MEMTRHVCASDEKGLFLHDIRIERAVMSRNWAEYVDSALSRAVTGSTCCRECAASQS